MAILSRLRGYVPAADYRFRVERNKLLMKTKIFVGLFVLVSSVAYSNGRTVNLPNDEFAIASITFPSSWRLSPVPNGMEGTSPDGAVYISVVAVGNSSGLVKDLKETQQILEKHKVTLDKSSQSENRFTVNGLPARELVYQGKDEDGRATVSFCKFDLGDKMIVTTYWVSTAQEKPHADEVRRIVLSLTASNGTSGVHHDNRKVR